MSNEAFVDFSKCTDMASLPGDLHKEVRTVQEILNLTPTVKDPKTKKYIANPTNIAVMSYWELTIRLIGKMVEQGLSYASEDYYVYVQFGGKPSVTKSPNGMIKGISKLASKQGYIANINVGCVYKDFLELTVTRDGLNDSIQLINKPEAEVMEYEIIAPFAVVSLLSRESRSLISRKVTIVRNNEYKNAKNQGSATHNYYPVPMAQKIALKRAAEEMAATLGIDDSVDLEYLRGEISEHNAEYDLSIPPKQEESPAQPESEPEVLPQYSEDDFAKNYPKWRKRVEDEANTPEDIIRSLLTKFTLTDDMLRDLDGLKDCVPVKK